MQVVLDGGRGGGGGGGASPSKLPVLLRDGLCPVRRWERERDRSRGLAVGSFNSPQGQRNNRDSQVTRRSLGQPATHRRQGGGGGGGGRGWGWRCGWLVRAAGEVLVVVVVAVVVAERRTDCAQRVGILGVGQRTCVTPQRRLGDVTVLEVVTLLSLFLAMGPPRSHPPSSSPPPPSPLPSPLPVCRSETAR